MHNVESVWYGRAMRFINMAGRMTLVANDGLGVDVERASGGRLPASPADALDRWPELEAWAARWGGSGDVEIIDALIGPPSSAPRQILGVGLNYASHAAELGFELPEHPLIFPNCTRRSPGRSMTSPSRPVPWTGRSSWSS